jgi:competence protein ComEC
MRRPLIFPFIGLITGIVIGNSFGIPYQLLLIGLLLTLALLFLSQRKQWRIAGFSLIFCFALISGILNIQKQQYLIPADQNILQHVDSGRKTVEGIIIESPSSYPDKKILIVRCLRILKDRTYIPVAGNINLVIPAEMNFSYGDFIRFHSVLKKIHSFKNPGGFDYEQYLNRQGIYAAGFIANEAGIVLLRTKSASSLKLQLESFRMYLKRIIDDNAPSPQREIITAMTIGDQNEIPADIRDNFNKTGTSHILSISGLHIGMVAATAFFLITVLLKSSEYLMLRFNIIKVAAAAAFVLVLLYALIAGMGVTVIRSALMALVFLIALILGKQRDLYNTLALAALVILVIAPQALFDISFQLSFVAVLAIIYIVPRFSNLSFQSFTILPIRVQSIVRYLYTTILVCVAATIGTLPLIIFYFNRVSLVTIIANLITVPLLGTVALAIAMAFVLSAFFSPAVAGFFVKLTSIFVQVSVEIINKLASFAWSSFSIIKPSVTEIFIFYLFLILLVQFIAAHPELEIKKGYFLRHHLLLKYSLLLTLIFIAGDIAYLPLRDRLSLDLKITAIDVGQGSSILVRFPGGENMLIDGGGFADSSFDMGKMVIAPYLYQERISRIDTVILTHPHPDHMQGLFYILDNFNVREVWSTGRIGEDEYHQKWQKIITQRQIKTAFLSAKSPAKKIRNAEIIFLWPPNISISDLKGLSDDDINDTSLVFKIKYGHTSFFITGDISSNIENLLIHSGKDLKSDVLFVPHHGSVHSSSTGFIRKIACRYAVISAGKGNAFHHPHPLILERYKTAQVQILRTDLDGAITMTTDGAKLFMETFVKHP